MGLRLRTIRKRAAGVHRVSASQARGRRIASADPDRPWGRVRPERVRLMSLRRRIAGAAALAVAAVAAAVAVIGYETTRSHLTGEVKTELRQRAQVFLVDRHHGQGGPGDEHGPTEQFHTPPPPGLGGATGYFQVVNPNGAVVSGGQLPVTRQVSSI